MCFFWVIAFPDDGGCVGLGFCPAVETVFGDIQFAAFKPFYFWIFKIPFEYGIEWFFPAEMRCDISPELFRVFNALFIHFMIFFKRFYLIGIGHRMISLAPL